jgi:lambda family phage tail tape measure protein
MGKANGIMDKFFETLKTGTQIAGVAIYAIIDDFNHLWGVVKLLGKDMYAVFDPKEYVNGTILETLNGNLKQFKDEWSDDAKSYEDSVKRIRDANSEIAQPVKQEKANRPIIEAGAKQILAAQDLAKEYENQQRIQMQMLEQKESLVFKTKEQKELEAAVNKVIDDNAKALEKVRAEMAKVDRNTVPGQRAYSEMQKQYNQIAGDLQNFKDQAEQIVTESQKQRESFSYGWQSAFNQYAENATTAADTGAKAFNTVVGTMDSALDTFVKKGKLNFHSLAQSIIQDLLSMQLKMQANRMFASLPGLGSLFGGGGVNIGTQSGADMMQAFADGGDPPVGQASLVGERGPELFIPKSAGTIIPNNQLGGMGGTTNNVTNYNISAIDTKSFEDRIYGSSNAVWAAGQYAQKNLATNRART